MNMIQVMGIGGPMIQWIGFLGKIYWFKPHPHISWENLWFPVDFPLNQSLESHHFFRPGPRVPGSQGPRSLPVQRTAFVSPSCENLDPDDDELVDELDEGEVQFGRHFLYHIYIY